MVHIFSTGKEIFLSTHSSQPDFLGQEKKDIKWDWNLVTEILFSSVKKILINVIEEMAMWEIMVMSTLNKH